MAFATDTDVAARLGVTFTTAQQAQATAIIGLIALEIEHATGTAEADIDSSLPILKVVSVQATVRAMANPTGAQTTSESLGQYSHSETLSRSAAESVELLTRRERSDVRNAVLGGPLISPRTPPIDDSGYLPQVDEEALVEAWLGGSVDSIFLFS